MNSSRMTPAQIAVSAAKQAVHESNEILKTAREQIAPLPQIDKKDEKPVEKPQTENSKPRNIGFLREYKNELDEIKRENLFKELQRKISEGENIPIENYAIELNSEQKDVLKAQIEAMNLRSKQNENQSKKNSIPEVISKKGRQMINKIKKQNEMHVETRQPPSS